MTEAPDHDNRQLITDIIPSSAFTFFKDQPMPFSQQARTL